MTPSVFRMNYHLVMLNKNTKFWRVTVFASVLEVTNEYLFSVLKHELIQRQEQRSQRVKSK